MALTHELQIYKDNYKLCKLILDYSRKVSKIIRHSEYAVIAEKSCQCLDLLRIINSDFTTRETYLEQYILLLNGIFNRVKLFVNTKFIDVKHGTNMIFLIDSLQKQATGWKKSAHKPESQKHR